LRATEPYSWTEVLEFPDYTKAQRRVRQEAAEFGLREGYVAPIVGLRTGTAIVQFAGLAADLGTHARAELRLAAIYAHARIRALSTTGRHAPPPAPLTLRERECLQWVAVGKSDWEIGEILSISEKTANFHVEQVKRKYNVATRVQAVVQAIRAGAIQP
jgi:LuxR family quorum sensing-dependent transcriptional regulator